MFQIKQPLWLTVAATLLSGCSATQNSPTAAIASDNVFARFTALHGDWTATFDSPDMPPSTVSYRTIANGSSVVETSFGGTPYEMISLFHRDGDRLLMTHYCAAQNQPHLIANEITDDSVSFVTDHVTNHADPNAMYMGEATWRFLDADHIQTTWRSFDKGERSEPHTFNLTRSSE